ncbi:MAG: hypothetical protein MI867_29345, partial [Pseudomonadales bacterium]|nr:hypothetical protein [Pseudomonadales bacterium]
MITSFIARKNVDDRAKTVFAICLSMATFPGQALALQAMNDSQLSGITGQDGLTVTLNTDQLAMENLNVELNSATPGDTAYLSASGVDFTPVNTAGALDTNPIDFTTTLDVGSDTAGDPFLSVGLDLSRTRLMVDNFTVGDGEPTEAALAANASSFGELAMDASAKLDYVNRGLFSAATSDAYLYGELTDFNLYYRQINDVNAPYFVGTGGTALWRVNDGSIGIKHHQTGDYIADLLGHDVYSMHTSSDFIDLQLDYNLGFKPGNGSSLRMTPDGATGMMRFGWTGTFYNTELDFSTRLLDDSSGLLMSSRTNYLRADGGTSANLTPLAGAVPSTSSAFRWIFGNAEEIPDAWGAPAASNRYATLMLSDWRNMYDNTGTPLPYGHDFPYIALGVVDGNTNTGYGDLCWGARGSGLSGGGCGAPDDDALYDYETLGFTVNRPALGVSIRQGNLLSYAETIDVYDGSDITQPFDVDEA